VKIRAKANRNVVDLPDKRARDLVRRGIFEYVEPAPGPDLGSLSKAELEKLAAGLEVEGTGAGGNVRKDDLVRALRYSRRDLRAEE
jgi:hypothetical protein